MQDPLHQGALERWGGAGRVREAHPTGGALATAGGMAVKLQDEESRTSVMNVSLLHKLFILASSSPHRNPSPQPLPGYPKGKHLAVEAHCTSCKRKKAGRHGERAQAGTHGHPAHPARQCSEPTGEGSACHTLLPRASPFLGLTSPCPLLSSPTFPAHIFTVPTASSSKANF